jgi:hypothetical protein
MTHSEKSTEASRANFLEFVDFHKLKKMSYSEFIFISINSIDIYVSTLVDSSPKDDIKESLDFLVRLFSHIDDRSSLFSSNRSIKNMRNAGGNLLRSLVQCLNAMPNRANKKYAPIVTNMPILDILNDANGYFDDIMDVTTPNDHIKPIVASIKEFGELAKVGIKK